MNTIIGRNSPIQMYPNDLRRRPLRLWNAVINAQHCLRFILVADQLIWMWSLYLELDLVKKYVPTIGILFLRKTIWGVSSASQIIGPRQDKHNHSILSNGLLLLCLVGIDLLFTSSLKRRSYRIVVAATIQKKFMQV